MDHAKATIYKTPSRGCEAFTVVWYEGNTRKRKVFAELALAETHATTKVTSQAHGELDILHLTGEERLAYGRAKEALAEFNLAVDSAAIEYRDAKRLLRGGSLLEAARYSSAHQPHDIPLKTIPDVYVEMLKAKRAEGLSERYLGDMESRVGRFAEKFQGQLTEIRGPRIKEWLQGLDVANRTRNNFRIALQTFFSFAKAQHYLPRNWNEFESVPLWKTKNDEVEIFTPEELSTLLAAADPRMILFLTIGAFADLRSAEIERLDWAKVNFKSGYITVDASIAKTNSRGLVPITDNLRSWLEPAAKKQGPVIELVNVPNAIHRLVESTRPEGLDDTGERPEPAVTWKHNALRHSYISYRVAQTQDVARVSLEAGNSPQMIFKHYRELVRPKDAEAWFNIKPDVVAEGQGGGAESGSGVGVRLRRRKVEMMEGTAGKAESRLPQGSTVATK